MSSNAESPIGIFDSGIGGLTVVEQIHRVLPLEDLIYLGDTARVPYGTKSPSTIVRFACEDTRFLLRHNVKAVVVACNTASAWALPTLRKRFDVPIFGVIAPGVRAALERTRNRRIGVIGTAATIRSEAYRKGILARDRKAKVFGRACPLLVPLVEEGWLQHAVTRRVLKEYLRVFHEHKVDTLILGCTHYPLLKKAIHDVLSRQIKLVDSAEACAWHVRAQLLKLKLAKRAGPRPGTIRPFVTDEVERFADMVGRFLAAPTQRAIRVQLAG